MAAPSGGGRAVMKTFRLSVSWLSQQRVFLLRPSGFLPGRRGGGATPHGGGARGAEEGGAAGGTPAPEDQLETGWSAVTDRCWLAAGASASYLRLGAEPLSCSGGSSVVRGPSGGRTRTGAGRSSHAPGYLGNRHRLIKGAAPEAS